MLFRVWSGSLHRPTKDVDLLGFGDATTAAVAALIREIINTAVEDDGILFDADSVQTEEIRENQEHGGIRATFTATLDKAVIPLQADVGFGDAITPAAEDRMYPVLIDMAAPRLRMYPVETVCARGYLRLSRGDYSRAWWGGLASQYSRRRFNDSST